MPSDYRHAGDAPVPVRPKASAKRSAARAVSNDWQARASGNCNIKGNRSRRGEWIYHVPGMPYYDQTRPEEIFCTEAEYQSGLIQIGSGCILRPIGLPHTRTPLGQVRFTASGEPRVLSERSVTFPIGFDIPSEPKSEDIRVQIELRLKRDDREVQVERLRHSGGNAPSQVDLCKLACRIYDARRQREKMLDHKLFGEPGWDMLLALYCLPSRGERLSVTALSGASAVSLTSALRWQGTLLEDGLIERIPDQADGRREFVRLTDKGRCMLEDYLLWLYRTGGLRTVTD